MAPHLTPHRRAPVLVLLLCGLTGLILPPAVAAPAPQPPQHPPLPAKLVAAWQQAGAQVGWYGINTIDWWVFQAEKEGLTEALPAFRFEKWSAGLIGSLPAPETPFGLVLSRTEVTDAGLEELAGLTTLRALGLAGTEVTDVGLQELARLPSLQVLDLFSTGAGVTDAGLKELKKLKSLRALDLSHTGVTDAGVKELKELQSLQALSLFYTGVTDAALQDLKELKNLQALGLAMTKVTD